MSVQLPAGQAAKQAQLLQNVALAGIKKTADNDQFFADTVQKQAESVAVSGSRGQNLNILV